MEHKIINVQINDLASSIQESLKRHTQGVGAASEIDTIVFEMIDNSQHYNPWFIPAHMHFAINLFVSDLQYIAKNNLIGQLGRAIVAGDTEKVPTKGMISINTSQSLEPDNEKIACILRTNAPFEGIALLLLIAASGYDCAVKITPELKHLFKNIVELIEVKFKSQFKISETESRFNEIGAVLAMAELGETTKEYFEKYAVLQLYGRGRSYIIDGNESDDLMTVIAAMICMYFGRGENSIKVLYIPEYYDFTRLKVAIAKYSDLLINNRYYNNFEYRKSAMIINHLDYFEIGPLLVTTNESQAGYTSVLCIQRYNDLGDIESNKLIEQYPLLKSGEGNPYSSYGRLSLSTFISGYNMLVPFLRELYVNRWKL